MRDVEKKAAEPGADCAAKASAADEEVMASFMMTKRYE